MLNQDQIQKHQQAMTSFMGGFVNSDCAIGSILRHELKEMAIQDEYTGLDNRLARDLREAQGDSKPIHIETVPSRFGLDELSGDFYNDRALFYANGTVEIVSYKGEGERTFATVEAYQEFVQSRLEPDEYDYLDDDDDSYF